MRAVTKQVIRIVVFCFMYVQIKPWGKPFAIRWRSWTKRRIEGLNFRNKKVATMNAHSSAKYLEAIQTCLIFVFSSTRLGKKFELNLTLILVFYLCGCTQFRDWWDRSRVWCLECRSPETWAFRLIWVDWTIANYRWVAVFWSSSYWPTLLWWWARRWLSSWLLPGWSSGGRFSCLAICCPFSISCDDFETKFWFDARTSRGCGRFRSDGAASGRDWNGILFPAREFGGECRPSAVVLVPFPAWILHWL